MRLFGPLPEPPVMRFRGHCIAQVLFGLWIGAVLLAFYRPVTYAVLSRRTVAIASRCAREVIDYVRSPRIPVMKKTIMGAESVPRAAE